jgi:hypothetical protein
MTRATAPRPYNTLPFSPANRPSSPQQLRPAAARLDKLSVKYSIVGMLIEKFEF